ncbi:origin-specific replication initiation factor [Trabulsiella guamensis ATCC 49490]|uniref:Origin-specific replication initiation factor n=1 Tax=Trabulsiella guamensis ATCC 49490 TaxID=1005994 RepID=A0A085AF46_9ENTR|nr:replication protein [Trabulsiella guamensis]KFC08841.1 origin-specific replication initiation factor [Trabulsiella guamensis ATCC 49490]
MGVARLEDYRKPPSEVVEHRVAELDDGYTKTANTLLEAVMLSGLTQHQLLIVMAVWRKTYGYNKKMDWIGNEQFSELTGMAATKCSTAKNELIRMGVLIQEGRHVGMNKNISEWKTKVNRIGKTFTESVKQTFTESVKQTFTESVKQTFTESVKPTFTESVKGSLPNQSNTKDNIQKTINTNTPLPPKGGCVEVSKPEKRKTVRINYNEYLEAYNEIVGDRLPHAVEINAERQRKLKKLINSLATKNIDGYRAYVKAFMAAARPFHFGDNDRGWVATFDYLLQPRVLTAIREGTL